MHSQYEAYIIIIVANHCCNTNFRYVYYTKSYQKMKKRLLILSYLILSLFISSCVNNNDGRGDIDSTSLTNEIVCTTEVDSIQSSLSYDEKTRAFLDIDYYDEIMIYDYPQGNVIKKVKNDSIKEEFVVFGLLDKNDSMFYVVAHSSLMEKIITTGWIQKKSYLRIFSSVYVGKTVLYKSPDRSSEVLVKVEYSADSYEVTDFCDRWLKIRVKEKGKFIEGWMPPEEQCCNVYSTCC